MNLSYLKTIRNYESEIFIKFLEKNCSILEIGAGAGWQSRALSEKGYKVKAIDISKSKYSINREWPVTIYDGKHIPYPEANFDAVISSNVLEHIPHMEDFQKEIQRILKHNGVAIHILPTGGWRFWTLLTHPFKLLTKEINRVPVILAEDKAISQKIKILLYRLYRFLYLLPPHRHGERGNAISEIFIYSRYSWLRLFKRTGWEIMTCSPNRLFYTGSSLMGGVLTIPMRRRLSYILGSACLIYVLKPMD